MFRKVDLTLEWASELPGGLTESQLLGFTQVSESVGLEWGQRIGYLLGMLMSLIQGPHFENHSSRAL